MARGTHRKNDGECGQTKELNNNKTKKNRQHKCQLIRLLPGKISEIIYFSKQSFRLAISFLWRRPKKIENIFFSVATTKTRFGKKILWESERDFSIISAIQWCASTLRFPWAYSLCVYVCVWPTAYHMRVHFLRILLLLLYLAVVIYRRRRQSNKTETLRKTKNLLLLCVWVCVLYDFNSELQRIAAVAFMQMNFNLFGLNI